VEEIPVSEEEMVNQEDIVNAPNLEEENNQQMDETEIQHENQQLGIRNNEEVMTNLEDHQITDDTVLEEISENQKALKKILYYESIRFPFFKFIPLAICWCTIFFSSFLKGGHGVPSIIPGLVKCEFFYWLIVFSSFPILIVISFLSAVYLRLFYLKKKNLGYKFADGDIHYTIKNTFFIPAVCLLAGIVAGFPFFFSMLIRSFGSWWWFSDWTSLVG
jgi:hypothetical protein